MPKIFIIILNYNGQDCLGQTLKSVFKLSYSDFQIVLVDNASTDNSFETARLNLPRSAFIKNPANLGFAAGMNIGIKYALERGADYVWLLNYDTEIKKDSLSELVSFMEKNKNFGLASPLIAKDDFSGIWFSGGKINWLKMKAIHEKENLERNNLSPDYLTGCALFIRKEVFKKIGLLEEKYFLYYEDADFSVRAKRAGLRLAVVKDSLIFHKEKSEIKKENKIYHLVLSGLIFFQKNSPWWLKSWMLFYTFLRKIKNRRDLKDPKNILAPVVEKAYLDFKKT